MQSSSCVRKMDWETSTSSAGDGGSSVCNGSACTTASSSSSEASSTAFKATQMVSASDNPVSL